MSITLLLSLIMVGSCAEERIDEAADQRPNIIIIFADDLGYGDLSCFGHPTIHTPHLDEMAREGIKMTSFYVGAPVCTPSRAALMTGRYPIRAGLPGNLGPDSPAGLRADERTLAEALSAQGYRTAAFGKWHLGAVPGYLPTDRGFDEYLGILYSNDMMPPWVNTERPLHLYRNDAPTDELPVEQSTLTRRYTDEAIRFLKQEVDQPYFIYLPYAMPHLPVSASEEFKGTSAGGLYGDVIEELDANVGRLLAAVKASGQEENTLVVFTSDNGPWRNMPPRMVNTPPVEAWHGGTTGSLAGAKATTMEGGSRVPAIARWVGAIPGNQISASMATTMDIHATVLAISGADSPAKALDGRNLLDFWRGEAEAPLDYFYYFNGRKLEGVRNADWKLRIAPPADGWTSPELATGKEKVTTTLFNMKNDPFEQFNLAEEQPETVKRLRMQLRRMATATGAELHLD